MSARGLPRRRAIARAALGTSLALVAGSALSPAAGSAKIPATRSDTHTAIAFAHVVTLSSGDLPEFQQAPPPNRHTARARHLEHQLIRCAAPRGLGAGGGEVIGDSFEREAVNYEQSANVRVEFASPQLVKAGSLGAPRSERAASACLTKRFRALLGSLRGPAVHVLGGIAVAKRALPAPGASASWGWRVSARIHVYHFVVRAYVDLVSFSRGPAAVTLFTSGAPVPFPEATERALFGALLARSLARRP
jgi:hypothetical protein